MDRVLNKGAFSSNSQAKRQDSLRQAILCDYNNKSKKKKASQRNSSNMESELASLQQFLICGINICQLLYMQGCLRDVSHKAILKTVPTLIFFSVNDTFNIQLSSQKSRCPSSSFPKTFPTQSKVPAFV